MAILDSAFAGTWTLILLATIRLYNNLACIKTVRHLAELTPRSLFATHTSFDHMNRFARC